MICSGKGNRAWMHSFSWCPYNKQGLQLNFSTPRVESFRKPQPKGISGWVWNGERKSSPNNSLTVPPGGESQICSGCCRGMQINTTKEDKVVSRAIRAWFSIETRFSTPFQQALGEDENLTEAELFSSRSPTPNAAMWPAKRLLAQGIQQPPPKLCSQNKTSSRKDLSGGNQAANINLHGTN